MRDSAGQGKGGASSARWLVLAVVVGALAFSFTGIFNHALWTPDEPRVGEIAREMAVSGDLVVPTLNGRPFLEKPPLAFWLMAGSLHLLGKSDGAVRLPSAIACLLTLLIVFDLARRMTDVRGGAAAAAVLATTGGFLWFGRRAMVDPWLTLFVTLGMYAFFRGTFLGPPDAAAPAPGEPVRSRAPWVIAVYAAMGLAFLVKGPLGIVLVAGPLGVALLGTRRWRLLRSWGHLPGIAVLLALCALWPWLLYHRGGWHLLSGFVVDNIIHRVTASGGGAHKKHFWYYLGIAPAMCLPWLVATPAAVRWLLRRRSEGAGSIAAPAQAGGTGSAGWNQPALRFSALLLPIGVVLLSIPATKREVYLLPLLPTLAPLVGAWLVAAGEEGLPSSLERWTVGGLVAILSLPALVGLVGAIVVKAGFRVEAARLDLLADGLGFGTFAALTLATVGFGAVAVWGVRQVRARDPRSVPVLLGGLVTLAVVHSMLTYRVVDPIKSLHRMTADLVRIHGFQPALVGYTLDETTEAIVPFDTGQHLAEAQDAASLRGFLQAHPGGKVLLIEHHLPMVPKDLRDRLQLRHRWAFTRRRIYCLYQLPAK